MGNHQDRQLLKEQVCKVEESKKQGLTVQIGWPLF